MLLSDTGFPRGAQLAYLASLGLDSMEPNEYDLCVGRGMAALTYTRVNRNKKPGLSWESETDRYYARF